MNFWNMGYGYGMMGQAFYTVGPILLVLFVWSVFWKGLGLWHSARRDDWIWFIILLVVNTLGILELIYLFGVLKLKSNQLFTKKPQK